MQSVKDAVEEQVRTGCFAGASPPTDAPSPRADEIFADGIETARDRLRRPGARDVHGTYDMDVDDDADQPMDYGQASAPRSVDPRLARRPPRTSRFRQPPPNAHLPTNIPPPGYVQINAMPPPSPQTQQPMRLPLPPALYSPTMPAMVSPGQ